MASTTSFLFVVLFVATAAAPALSSPQPACRCTPGDLHALLAVKQSLGNPKTLSTWSPAKSDCCQWDHVRCDEAGRVNNVFIDGADDVHGQIPSAVAGLTALSVAVAVPPPGAVGHHPALPHRALQPPVPHHLAHQRLRPHPGPPGADPQPRLRRPLQQPPDGLHPQRFRRPAQPPVPRPPPEPADGAHPGGARAGPVPVADPVLQPAHRPHPPRRRAGRDQHRRPLAQPAHRRRLPPVRPRPAHRSELS
uniref:Leucine-rich repeat-containing N-terminal plant-type domain-containing protein n=1 Tax=Zoysia matrella TaxID=38722 RepID=A0A0C4MLF8_9POAL|nr:hypothetical protein [Zoysia matrella]